MGDASAEHSIERVIEAHGDELFDEAVGELQRLLRALGVEVDSRRIDGVFAIEADQLTVRLVAKDGDEEPASARGLAVIRYDIAELARRFPDCEVAW